MNAGKDVHTLMRTIEVPAEYDVGEGYGQTKWNVRAIWENYAGWFHHDSSTELYGVSPRSVHPDLVELAGAEAIVAAARKRLDAGEPLEAIHLAEIAGDNLAALEVLVAAHEILLAESVNFWERSWLQRRLEVLGKQIGSHQ
jgi:alkyl sulfatase BDS1-like metallo-beta-lactamase superfamily hydrolase